MTYPLQIAERDELLAKARSIREIIEGDAEKSEADRTLAMTSVNAMYDSGILNMCVPRSLGGLEADPVTQTEVYEAISAITVTDDNASTDTAPSSARPENFNVSKVTVNPFYP